MKELLQSPSISFNLLAVVLMLTVISPLRAVVVPVELPEGIKTPEDIRFQWYRINETVDSTLKSLNLSGIKDVVIIFTRDGKIITPEDLRMQENLTKLPARDIEPERGDGWTDSEWNEVLYVWNLAYPRLKRIYGWPYCKCGGWLCMEKHKVKITKDPDLDVSGVFIPRFGCWFNSEIKLKGWSSMYGHKWGPVLIHEMAHAFRNWKVVPYDQFEEGHAEFVEVEVSTLIFEETGNFWDYPYLYHNDEITNSLHYYYPFTHGTYSLFQQYNTDFLRVGAYMFSKEFGINMDLVPLRYHIAGFSWWKLWLRVYNFFVDFNNAIYSYSDGLPLFYDDYKAIARRIVGSTSLEDDLYFDDWWERQQALRGDVTISHSFSCSSTAFGLVGSFLGRNMKILLYLYWRERAGLGYNEVAVPSWVDVRLIVKDHYGAKILDTVVDMGGRRHKTMTISDSHPGTYKIHAYPTACPELYQERVAYFPGTYLSSIVDTNPDLTFIALVGSEPNGSIVIIPPNRLYSTLTGFYIHEWPIKRARYTIYDRDHPDRWNLFIKDKAPYVIYPGGWAKVPPGQPQDVRVLFKDLILGLIALTWKPNEEIDMDKYKVVWTSYDTTGRVDTNYIYTRDTIVAIGYTNAKNCIVYMANVYAIDKNGNVSGKSNTVIDGWWSEECGPMPFMYEKSLAKVPKVAEESKGEMIKVYDSSGRLIYEGKEGGFHPKVEGVFFIYKDGKVKKEVLR